jgi:hypothetical protein
VSLLIKHATNSAEEILINTLFAAQFTTLWPVTSVSCVYAYFFRRPQNAATIWRKAGAWRCPPTPYSAEIKELYSTPIWASWPVLERNLPLLLPHQITTTHLKFRTCLTHGLNWRYSKFWTYATSSHSAVFIHTTEQYNRFIYSFIYPLTLPLYNTYFFLTCYFCFFLPSHPSPGTNCPDS